MAYFTCTAPFQIVQKFMALHVQESNFLKSAGHNSHYSGRPTPFALRGRGSGEIQMSKLCSTHWGQQANQIAAITYGQLFLCKSASRLPAMWLPIKAIAGLKLHS